MCRRFSYEYMVLRSYIVYIIIYFFFIEHTYPSIIFFYSINFAYVAIIRVKQKLKRKHEMKGKER